MGEWAHRAPVRLAEVDSTQNAARALADAGAVEGTVIWAEHQTRGRGRLGRSWLDEPGAALLISVILRPRSRLALLPQLSLLAGVAAAEALSAESGLPVMLDWPNDLLIRGRKVAGVLAESFASKEGRAVVILGIGVNVNQSRFPDALAARATSLRLETGRPLDREALLTRLCEGLEVWYHRWEEEGFAPVRREWCRASATLGRRIEGEDGAAGIAVDLAEDGALVLRTDAGALLRRVAGALREEEPR